MTHGVVPANRERQEMLQRVILGVLAVWMAMSLPVAAQSGPKPMAGAFAAAEKGDWATAAALGARAGAGGPELVEWLRLRAGAGTPAEVLTFLKAHPDWPGLRLLRRRAEAGFVQANDAQVLAFFATAPQTGTGALRHAQALTRAGKGDAAKAALIAAWRTLDLSDAEQSAFVADHAALLAPHHTERLENAMWAGRSGDVRAMLPLVPAGWQALARAWTALENGTDDGVNALIAAVPKPLADHAVLAQARFDWRVRKDRDAEAITLILERSGSAAALGRPEEWAARRLTLAHAEMRAGNHSRAYALAARHHLKDGSRLAELEWLAGYVALRWQNDPARALTHFARLRDAVASPISLGRAQYWLGRAHEATGNTAAARAAYAEGAKHQTSFYGLLAAERGGIAFDASLAGKERFADWREARFRQGLVYKAALLAYNAGNLGLAETFLTHLAEGQDRKGLGQLGEVAEALDDPHLAVMIGKEAAGRGITLARPYYPLHPMAAQTLPVPKELALSIARRESEFDPVVVSGAGAEGLMQVMPRTAAEVAGQLGITHTPRRMITDPSYNARIGSAYLARLIARYDGNAVLVAAAYNAGPSRPDRWMQEMGDPRAADVDVVDWIEAIPFAETRNYVMRVTESLPVYRARLGLKPHPVPFSVELKGGTLR